MKKGIEGFDGFDKAYSNDQVEMNWHIVSEIIPYIGTLYGIKREGSRVTVADIKGEIVLDTDITHFQKLMEAEKASRNYRENKGESEEEDQEDNETETPEEEKD